MDNYCSHCGHRLRMDALEQQRASMSHNPFMPLGSGGAFGGAFGCLPSGSAIPAFQEEHQLQALGIAQSHYKYKTYWGRVNAHLTAEEMEEERERMRADERL